jgi:hypothetical protein
MAAPRQDRRGDENRYDGPERTAPGMVMRL